MGASQMFVWRVYTRFDSVTLLSSNSFHSSTRVGAKPVAPRTGARHVAPRAGARPVGSRTGASPDDSVTALVPVSTLVPVSLPVIFPTPLPVLSQAVMSKTVTEPRVVTVDEPAESWPLLPAACSTLCSSFTIDDDAAAVVIHHKIGGFVGSFVMPRHIQPNHLIITKALVHTLETVRVCVS